MELIFVLLYCIAESTMYAYTDRPYLVIPDNMPCGMGQDKIKQENGHSDTPNVHFEAMKTTRKHFLVLEVH